MPRPIPEELLTAVPALLAVVQERSATRAARRLGTTAATVLRRIDAVEQVLGVRVFNRLPTGLEPTEALARILPWAEQVVGAVAGMHREVSGLEQRVEGTVRVAMPTAVASELLVPRLASLRQRHPDVVVELASAIAVVDLPHRDADLALRTARPAEGALVARAVASFRYVLACAPSLLQGRGQADPMELPWIQWDRRTTQITEARWLSSHVPESRVVLRASDMPTIVRAAQAGLGAIVIAEPIALAAGGLVAIDTELPLPKGTSWLVAHQALRDVPRVAAVREWIEQVLGEGPMPRLAGWAAGG
ncbi:MAG: LysR family transcriptional regulator [Nannocystaceae bacterium]